VKKKLQHWKFPVRPARSCLLAVKALYSTSMPQKQIGSISEIELWQAGILRFKSWTGFSQWEKNKKITVLTENIF